MVSVVSELFMIRKHFDLEYKAALSPKSKKTLTRLSALNFKLICWETRQRGRGNMEAEEILLRYTGSYGEKKQLCLFLFFALTSWT